MRKIKVSKFLLYLFLTCGLAYFSLVGFAYTRCEKQSLNKEYILSLCVTGDKNIESQGTEARILQICVASSEINLEELARQNINGLYENGMLVVYGGELQIPFGETEDIDITMLKHPWSGVVDVSITGLEEHEKIDLYSPQDDTAKYSYSWDELSLWNSAYRLTGLELYEVLSLGAILLLVFACCIRAIEKFYDSLKNSTVKISGIVRMLCAFFLICLLTIYTIYHTLRWGIILLIVAGILGVLWSVREQVGSKLEYIYVIIYGTVSILWLFFLPPGHVPDEFAHYVKVYEASSENAHTILKEGAEYQGEVYIHLPQALANLYEEYMLNCNVYGVTYEIGNYFHLYRDAINEAEVAPYDIWFGNTKGLNNMAYVFDILLQGLMTKLHLSPILCLQLLRFMHSLLYALAGYVILHIIPNYKRIFFIILLLPMTIQQSIGINQDWMTNLVVFGIAAYVLYLGQSLRFTWKDFAFLILMSFVLGNVKPGYFSAIWLVFLLPKDKFYNRKYEYLCKFAIVFPCMLLTILAYTSSAGAITSDAPLPYYQISDIFAEPLKMIKIYVNTLLEWGDEYFITGLLTGFGWYTHYTYPFLRAVEGILLVVLILGANEKINGKIQVGSFCVFAVTCIFLFTSLLLLWTQNDRVIIDGLQPRYFIVTMLFLGIAVQNKIVNICTKNKDFLYACCMMLFVGNGLLTITTGFYG